MPITTGNCGGDFATINEFLKNSRSLDELLFTRLPFNYPLTICYSSGTTGAPKCIVHQHGIVLQSKISILHNCLSVNDRAQSKFKITAIAWKIMSWPKNSKKEMHGQGFEPWSIPGLRDSVRVRYQVILNAAP